MPLPPHGNSSTPGALAVSGVRALSHAGSDASGWTDFNNCKFPTLTIQLSVSGFMKERVTAVDAHRRAALIDAVIDNLRAAGNVEVSSA